MQPWVMPELEPSENSTGVPGQNWGGRFHRIASQGGQPGGGEAIFSYREEALGGNSSSMKSSFSERTTWLTLLRSGGVGLVN